MNPRIQRLADYASKEDINPASVPVEFDPFDEKLAEPMMIAKRLTEYLLAQPVILSDDSELIGIIRFYASPVPADLFTRAGHTLSLIHISEPTRR